MSTISNYDVIIVLSLKLIYFGERFPELSLGDIGQKLNRCHLVWFMSKVTSILTAVRVLSKNPPKRIIFSMKFLGKINVNRPKLQPQFEILELLVVNENF